MKDKGRPLTVTELLDKASNEVGQRFADRPLLEARFRMVLAEALDGRFARGEAFKHATRAWELRRRLLGQEHQDTLASRALQAQLIAGKGWLNPEHYASALPIAREVFAARGRVLGPAHPDTIGSASLLSWLLCQLQEFDQGVRLAEQAVAMAEASLGAGHPDTISARLNLGKVLLRVGRVDESVALLRVIEEECEEKLGPFEPETLAALNNLGLATAHSGELDGARRLMEVAVQRAIHMFGFCHPITSSPLGRLQGIMRQQGDFAGLRNRYQRWITELLATPLEQDQHQRHRRAVWLAGSALHLATLPPSIPFDGALAIRAAEEATILSDDWSGAWSFLGVVHYRLGHLDLAEQAVRTALNRQLDPQEHPFDPLVLALIYARRGDRARAFAEFENYRTLFKENLWLESRDPLEVEARALLGLSPGARSLDNRQGRLDPIDRP